MHGLHGLRGLHGLQAREAARDGGKPRWRQQQLQLSAAAPTALCRSSQKAPACMCSWAAAGRAPSAGSCCSGASRLCSCRASGVCCGASCSMARQKWSKQARETPKTCFTADVSRALNFRHAPHCHRIAIAPLRLWAARALRQLPKHDHQSCLARRPPHGRTWAPPDSPRRPGRCPMPLPALNSLRRHGNTCAQLCSRRAGRQTCMTCFPTPSGKRSIRSHPRGCARVAGAGSRRWLSTRAAGRLPLSLHAS